MTGGEKSSDPSLQKIATRRILIKVAVVVFIVTVMLWFVRQDAAIKKRMAVKSPQGASAARIVISNVDELKASKDPVAMHTAGRYWLSHGKPEFAEKCFRAAVKNEEINLYARRFAKSAYAEAWVKELMGDFAAARVIWRRQLEKDVPSTLFYLTRLSSDAEKKKIISEARTIVQKAATAAKAGETPHWYTTRKGKSRKLKKVTAAEALEYWRAGKLLKYAYIDELDLTDNKFQAFIDRPPPTVPAEPIKGAKKNSKKTKLKKAVAGKAKPSTAKPSIRCLRCVIGTLRTYGSTFKGQTIKFPRTVFLNQVHFGKKINKKSLVVLAPGAEFYQLRLDWSVFLGPVNFDSVKFIGNGAKAYFPLSTFVDSVDMKNIYVDGVFEMRFANVMGLLRLKQAKLLGSAYMGNVRVDQGNLSKLEVDNQVLYLNSAVFRGRFEMENALLKHGVTFENARFKGPTVFRSGHYQRLSNLSRAIFDDTLHFEDMKLDDLLALGTRFSGQARFNGSVFSGRSSFGLDTLTRRENLKDVTPLHTVYKRYQGDDDAEKKLTTTAQYGVRSVNDLIAQFKAPVSFSNVTFGKLVTFERVVFGAARTQAASFFNTQFEGEAHFEHARFSGSADFRTITANEISFNGAQFNVSWILDDANVLGRMSLTEAEFSESATISTYGADISSFGIGLNQLIRNPNETWRSENFRLFYLHCLLAGQDNEDYWNDKRLFDARWNAELEVEITDKEIIRANVERICINRAVGEFTMLRDSFSGRSMLDESDWAYWHLKHYKNHRSSRYAPNILYKTGAFLNWLLFEKAFGWGVLLENLMLTLLVTIVIFVGFHYWLCGDMRVIWDGEEIAYREMPFTAMLLLSTSAVLVDSGLSASLVPEGRKWWKYLYTAEVAIGIIVVTFFIGAYTRLVVSG